MSVKVRYIGNQPTKSSNRVNEKYSTLWTGHGDVQLVSDQEATDILKPQFSRIWERVLDAAPKDTDQSESGQTPRAPTNTDEAAAVESQPDGDKPAGEEGLAGGADDDKEVTADQVRDRLVQIVTAIPSLKVFDFDAQGRPKLSALRAILKRHVTSLERDAAWDLAKSRAKVPEAQGAVGEAEKAPE